MTSELVVESWTNDIGQTIHPGDEVIFVGSSRKNTSVSKGIFGGVYYANVTRTVYLKDENGNYIKEEKIHPYSKQPYLVNKTERITTREVVAVRVERVNRGTKGIYEQDENGKFIYKKTDDIIWGVSTLPLKRVYKIATTLAESHHV
jgi:hypothetical protein